MIERASVASKAVGSPGNGINLQAFEKRPTMMKIQVARSGKVIHEININVGPWTLRYRKWQKLAIWESSVGVGNSAD